MIESLRFSLFELLAILGLIQSVAVLVYMAFRSGHIAHAVIPVLYFLVIGSAFYSEFAEVFIAEYYYFFHWFAFFLWASVPALSVLLIAQLARSPRHPHFAYYGFLLLPVLLFITFAINHEYYSGLYDEYLPILSVVFGAITLLGLWVKRDLLTQLYNNQINAGADRYWLSMALIFFNVLFIAGLLLESLGAFQAHIWDMLRLIVTNVFVYLASTSLFRIYPQAFFVTGGTKRVDDKLKQVLNVDELQILEQLVALFDVEKVYQESSLTRTELAQELKISEGLLSRLVSAHYNKSVPQLINSYRVQDAAALIAQTDAAIKDIAEEAGFSSIATFNRVFKDITGKSPSAHRKDSSHIIH
jgi:AraC-like DNA-binding protein|tara:strand:- start:332988 stop:334061 length:1074 start_codon:yes stop_codon:yes gene_type:complete